MKMLKICCTCDRILGEIESEDLTINKVDLIMDIVGNVAYTLCPDCLSEMETLPRTIYQ